MIDLSQVPRELFFWALKSNLREIGSRGKLVEQLLAAVRLHLSADAAWLYRDPAEGGASLVQVDGEEILSDDALSSAFFREERPQLPRTLLLSPVKVHGRRFGVVGAARREEDFDLGTGRVLNRMAAMLGKELSRREEARQARVLDRLKEKVVAELEPRDLAYQILDGLYQLVHYDHSAALLIYDADAGVFRVEAEKIVWTKTKSAFIGHELIASPDLLDDLRSASDVRLLPGDGELVPADARLRVLLDYYRGQGIPAIDSLLCAPLFFDETFLGLLKIASYERPPFDDHDRGVMEQFLPIAAVALRNARVKSSLEDQAVQAEIRASLVTLARAVAHDVNNAMGSLLPLAKQVREELEDGESDLEGWAQDLDVIIDKASLCRRIFSNMLRVATKRGGSGPVDLNQVLREMLPLLEAETGPHQVELRLDLADSLPLIRFSRHHLERLVWNLVTNATEAMADGGGTVAISTGTDGGGGRDILLTVADDGPGIAPDQLAKAQEPFYSTKDGGTGLGLAICRSLAWQYGGGIQIDGAPGGGTRVQVRLLAAALDETTVEEVS